jgi:hypothetical protein
MPQRMLQAWRARVALAVTFGLGLLGAPVARATPRIQPDAPPFVSMPPPPLSRSRRPASAAGRRSRCRPAVRPAASMSSTV